jgi:hypothetical protein
MAEKRTLSKLNWAKYPVRQCRYLDHCEFCGNDIKAGEMYRDGGYSRRAHVVCTPNPTVGAEPPCQEQPE